MNAPVFRTNEVAQLYKDVRAWSHEEYPFLDAHYSPGSHAPAIDLTPYIASWISEGNLEPIVELWEYLTCPSPASGYALRKALNVRLPQWIHTSDALRHELHAIYLMTIRAGLNSAQDISRVGVDLAAAALACDVLTVDGLEEHRLAKAMQAEFALESFPQLVLNKAEAMGICLRKAASPLAIAESAAQRLKVVPPMVRLIVFDYQTRSWGTETLRFDLYYGERMYGCGDKWNQHYVEWLDFFGLPDDASSVPAALTKAVLTQALLDQQIECKKTATRKQMIEMVKKVPGLLGSLIHQVYPENRKLRPEWADAIGEWTMRVKLSRPVAAGLLKLMSANTV